MVFTPGPRPRLIDRPSIDTALAPLHGPAPWPSSPVAHAIEGWADMEDLELLSCRSWLARGAMRRGDLESAKNMFITMRDRVNPSIAMTPQGKHALADMDVWLGVISAAQGNQSAAHRYLQAALTSLDGLTSKHDQRVASEVLYFMSIVSITFKSPYEAVSRLEEARRRLNVLDMGVMKPRLAQVLQLLAFLHAELGRVSEAGMLYRELFWRASSLPARDLVSIQYEYFAYCCRFTYRGDALQCMTDSHKLCFGTYGPHAPLTLRALCCMVIAGHHHYLPGHRSVIEWARRTFEEAIKTLEPATVEEVCIYVDFGQVCFMALDGRAARAALRRADEALARLPDYSPQARKSLSDKNLSGLRTHCGRTMYARLAIMWTCFFVEWVCCALDDWLERRRTSKPMYFALAPRASGKVHASPRMAWVLSIVGVLAVVLAHRYYSIRGL